MEDRPLKPALAAPDLWIIMEVDLPDREALSQLDEWLRQLPFPCCKPKAGCHTPESYRDSVLRRCIISYDRIKWCYSEVLFQFYKSENSIKIKGIFRNPRKVRIWPTVFTNVLKAWQIKKDLAMRVNPALKTLCDGDGEFYELEPRPIDEIYTGSEVCFYATHFPESKRFRQCLLLTDSDRNCAKDEFLKRIGGQEGVANKYKIAEYLHQSDLYGVICIDRPGGNYLLWIPQQLTHLTGVSVKSDLHYMEVRGEYETYPKRDYVGSRVLTKETCLDMTSTYKTFDFPGQHANLDEFFWSYKIPW